MDKKAHGKSPWLFLLIAAGVVLLAGIALNVGPSLMAGTMQEDLDKIVWQSRTPGETGYLRLANDASPGHTICLAPSVDIYEEYTKAMIAQDATGAMRLTNNGLFCVGNGTVVKVLDISALLTQVRIVSGVNEADQDNIGMSGWTAKERVVEK